MKQRVLARLPTWAAALWWGSLTTVGFLVVPLLFAKLPQVSMAGYMAAQLFAAQTWVSVVCCVALIVLTRPPNGEPQDAPMQKLLPWVLGGLLLALVLQYGVAPRIVARQNMALWHNLGTAMFAVQWLCAAVTLWKLSDRR